MKLSRIKYASVMKSYIYIVLYFRVAVYQSNTNLLGDIVIEFFSSISKVVSDIEPDTHLDGRYDSEVKQCI